MKEKLLAFGVSLLCIMAVSLLVLSVEKLDANKQYPGARQGVMDLQTHDFESGGPVKLDGEWSFYDGELMGQSDIDSGKFIAKRRTVQVPRKWTEYGLQRAKPTAYGYGTFHLKVLLDRNAAGSYALKTTSIIMSNQIAVNGLVIGASGKPDVDKKRYTPENVPYRALLDHEDGTLDIIVWVANYDYSTYGGMINSLHLGLEKDITEGYILSSYKDLMVATALIVIGMIFGVLYFSRRKATYLVWFSLYNFAGSIYIITHGEKILYHLTPHLDYRVFGKLQYLSAGLYVLFFMLYLIHSFPNIFRNKVSKLLVLASLLFLPFGFLAPMSIHSIASSYQMVFIQLALVYSVYRLVLGVFLGEEDSILVGISAIIVLFMVVIAAQNVLGNVDLDSLFIYSQGFLVLNHAFLIAGRLSRTYDQVESLSRELISVDKRKDEFLVKTAHELRTPLQGMANIVALFLEREKDDMSIEDAQSLQLVIDSSERLTRLVLDIFDLDQIREGKLKLEYTKFSIENSFREVSRFFRSLLPGGTVEVEYHVESDVTDVHLDNNRFKQILYNLIECNSRNNGSSFVRITGKRVDGQLEVGVSSYTASEEKMVRRHGVSIEETVSDSWTEIGRRVVEQLVRLMDGRIEVFCDDQGLQSYKICFEVDWNKAAAGSAPSDATETELPHDYPEGHAPYLSGPEAGKHSEIKTYEKTNSTILLVDSDFSSRRITAHSLKADGHDVVEVKTGKEAIDVVQVNRDLDLIIVDLNLSDMLGHELCRAVRAYWEASDLPILIATATLNRNDLKHALSAGANDFIHKPYGHNELRARVSSLLLMKNQAGRSSLFELAFLHAQLKPHFLYNALNTIAELCIIKPPEASNLIISLARYLRGVLDFSNVDRSVSIGRELTLVNAYLAIEKARYPELSVEFAVEVDSELSVQLRIPPMTLQVLVENAVKHGHSSHEEGGAIKIAMEKVDGGYMFSVENDGLCPPIADLQSLLEKPRAEVV